MATTAPAPDVKRARALRSADATEVIVAALGRCDELSFRDAALIAVGRDAMLRAGELAGLRWRDVEWLPGAGAGALLSLGATKGDRQARSRYRPAVGAYGGELLEVWRDLQGLGDAGARCFGLASTSTVGRRVRTLCLDAGIGDGFSGHSLRRGAAHDLAASGADPYELRHRGRWRSFDTVLRYIDELGGPAGSPAVLDLRPTPAATNGAGP